MALPSTYLTIEMVEDATNEVDLSRVKELILRDMCIDDIDADCTKELQALEILSLSHNRLKSVHGLENLTNLLEININRNQIESLDGLNSRNLRRLYASSNQLTEVEPLRKFPLLQTLSLYGNNISDFDSCLNVLRQLPKLRSLDLDGNPASRCDGYKYRVVRALPRLEELDGETITSLDKELAEEYQSSGSSTESKRRTSGRSHPTTTESRSNDPFSNSEMPRGNVQLFRSNFLNNNPILLEYLAQGAIENSTPGSSAELVEAIRTDFDESAEQNDSSFVNRLRASATDNKSDDTTDTTPPPATENSAIPLPAEPRRRPSASSVVDPSNPHATIRKLLKMIQLLQDERNELLKGNSTGGISMEELMEENRRLQIENNNINILQEENRELRAKLQSPASASNKDLEQKNRNLQKSLNEANEIIAKLRERLDTKNQAADSKQEILDLGAEFDPELTELIMRNEVSLQQIRQDIRRTKRDLRQDRANDLSGRLRPQTSAGREFDHRSGLESNQSNVPQTTPPRRLHTSAGQRPSNLLGRGISTEFDMEEAKEAVAQAQEQMKILHQAREILQSRGNLMDPTSLVSTKQRPPEESDDDDDIEPSDKQEQATQHEPNVMMIH